MNDSDGIKDNPMICSKQNLGGDQDLKLNFVPGRPGGDDNRDRPDEDIVKDSEVTAEGSVFDNLQNPLLLNVVLNTIFEYLDLKNLQSCRLVCKDWYDASAVYHRKKSILIPRKCISSCANGEPQATLHEIVGRRSYNKFFEKQNFPKGLPSDSVYISQAIPSHSFANADSAQVSWLQEWGKDLKGLRLDLKVGGNEENGSVKDLTLKNILISLCPNLELLEIREVRGPNGKKRAPKELDLEGKLLPKLKSLKLCDGNKNLPKTVKLNQGHIYYQYVESIFSAAINLECVEVCAMEPKYSHSSACCITEYVRKNLKKLTWRNFLYPSDLLQLQALPQDTNLRVLDLNCAIFPIGTIIKVLHNLLSKVSPSLEVLKMKGQFVEQWDSDGDSVTEDSSSEDEEQQGPGNNGGGPPPAAVQNLAAEFQNFFFLTLPLMEKLKVFELDDIFHCRVNTLDFLLDIPNLKRLQLKNVAYASDVRPLRPEQVFMTLVNDSLEIFDDPHTELEELYLYGNILGTEFIDGIAVGFPNLKILDICVETDEVFVRVFQKLKAFSSLEELNIRFKGILDVDWCTSAFIFHLPRLKTLSRLKLNNRGTLTFPIREKVIQEGFAGAKNLRSVEFINFAILKGEEELVVEHLKNFVLVKFTDCIIQAPAFNATYGRWQTRKPIPEF